MRNWGTVVTAFYIVVVAALSPIFGFSVAFDRNFFSSDPSLGADWVDATAWIGWTLLLAGGPLVLLLVSVDVRLERLKSRRHILMSAAAAALALSLLLLSAVVSIGAAIMGDHDEDWFWIVVLTMWIGSLLLWTLALWRMGERLFDPKTRIYRWLIKGSVLELLIAVPSHVIVRARHDCCAPGVTGMGIATGLAILLMSIGPGALFLYRARMRRISAPRAGEVHRSSSTPLRHQTAAEDQGR